MATREGCEMAVHRGILKELSGGTQQVSTLRADNAFVRHEFIEIGDERLKSIRLLTYHNKLLERAIGQEVALSVIKNGRRASSSPPSCRTGPSSAWTSRRCSCPC
jgi:hypothetical protein